MRIIFNLTISIYLTSTIFMLICWANAVKVILRQTGKVFVMPIDRFIYLHFCPIVNTIKCFKIMKREAQLMKERGI